jgi:hypothetical protein
MVDGNKNKNIMKDVLIKNNTEFDISEIFGFLAGFRAKLEESIFAYKISGDGYDTILVGTEPIDPQSDFVKAMYGGDLVRI